MDITEYLSLTFGVSAEEAYQTVFPYLQWYLYANRVLDSFWTEVKVTQDLTTKTITIDAPEYIYEKYFYQPFLPVTNTTIAIDRQHEFNDPKLFSRIPMTWELTSLRGWVTYWISFNKVPVRHKGPWVNVYDLTEWLSPKSNEIVTQYGNIKNTKIIEGELYCLMVFFCRDVFQKNWYPFPIRTDDLLRNLDEVAPPPKLASTLPVYNIYDCIPYTLETTEPSRPHNAKPADNECYIRRQELLNEKQNIEVNNSEKLRDTKLLDTPTTYILLQIDQRSKLFINDAKLAQRYHDIHYYKNKLISFKLITIHPSCIDRLLALLDSLSYNEATQAWQTLHNADMEERSQRIRKQICQSIENGPSVIVGWTNAVYPFKSLMQHFYSGFTDRRFKELRNCLQLLRENNALPRMGDNTGELMVESLMFLVWTVARKGQIEGLNFTARANLIELQNDMQLFTRSLISNMYLATTHFPIKFLSKPPETEVIRLIEGDFIRFIQNKNQFIDWIKQQCKANGYHTRSFRNSEELYEIKHMAKVAGPFHNMHKGKLISDRVIDILDLEDEVIYSFGRSFATIEWFLDNLIRSLSVEAECLIAKQYVAYSPIKQQCECKYHFFKDTKRKFESLC